MFYCKETDGAGAEALAKEIRADKTRADEIRVKEGFAINPDPTYVKNLQVPEDLPKSQKASLLMPVTPGVNRVIGIMALCHGGCPGQWYAQFHDLPHILAFQRMRIHIVIFGRNGSHSESVHLGKYVRELTPQEVAWSTKGTCILKPLAYRVIDR